MIPAPNAIAMNSDSDGKKCRIPAMYTDKQTGQSKGFNLFPAGYFNLDLIQLGMNAIFTK